MPTGRMGLNGGWRAGSSSPGSAPPTFQPSAIRPGDELVPTPLTKPHAHYQTGAGNSEGHWVPIKLFLWQQKAFESPQSWSLINFLLLGHKSCFLLLLNTIPQILPSSSWLAQPGHSAHLSLLPSLPEATAGNADQHPHTLTIWGSSCRGHTGKGWGRRGDGSPGINSSMKTEFPRTGGRGTKKQSSLIEISHGQGSAAPPLPCLLALGLLLILV